MPLPCYRYGMICHRSSLIRQSSFRKRLRFCVAAAGRHLNTLSKYPEGIWHSLLKRLKCWRKSCAKFDLHVHLKKWTLKFKLLYLLNHICYRILIKFAGYIMEWIFFCKLCTFGDYRIFLSLFLCRERQKDIASYTCQNKNIVKYKAKIGVTFWRALYMLRALYAIARRLSVCNTGGSVKNGCKLGFCNFYHTVRITSV